MDLKIRLEFTTPTFIIHGKTVDVLSFTEFRTQQARWIFYLSQIFTDEQKPFCEQGEPTNAGKRRQIAQSLSAIHQHQTINT